MTNSDTEDPERARSLVAHALTSFIATLKSPQLGNYLISVVITL